MAELTIRPEEIRDALDNFVQNYEPETAVREEVLALSTSLPTPVRLLASTGCIRVSTS